MEENVYIVTLHNKEDLEEFYDEMEKNNFSLVLKRPLSRNTHYLMTAEQAEKLRHDNRVWGVELQDDFIVRPQVINNQSYVKSGNFWKGSSSVSPNDFQWGHLHVAGDQSKRRKNQWGSPVPPWSYDQVVDTVTIFNDGKHVDVVIVDDPVGHDAEEWYSPTTNQTRFFQYQWFNQLNPIVSSIDDDGQALPSGTIVYHTTASVPYFHGMHVTGTACGQYYGWAREANIYNMAVTGTWASGQSVGALLIFDYLRAFHLSKSINPQTGKKNPTITNHSYGGIRYMPSKGGGINRLDFADLISVTYQGVTYSSANPGPSGWFQGGVETDFGVRFGVDTYPSWSAAVAADVQDAIDDGVVIIGAAGNDNLLIAAENDANWNNTISISGVGTIYYNRGAWPNSPDSGAITVGALNKQADFRRSTYTQFGPGVNVFSPGDNIISSYDNGGFNDTKYTRGSANYFYPIQGTSMASPQVCGIAAILATDKARYTNNDALGHIKRLAIEGDMTFDLSGGSYSDNTCRKGSPNLYLHVENPRKVSGYVEEARKGMRTNGMVFPRRNTYFRET